MNDFERMRDMTPEEKKASALAQARVAMNAPPRNQYPELLNAMPAAVVCKIGNTTVMTRDHRFPGYDRLLAKTWSDGEARQSRWQRFVSWLRRI